MAIKRTLTPWQNIPDDITKLAGFVYDIENKVTGQKYIGRKYFYSRNKNIMIESDWKTYKSSSEHVQEAIAFYGIDNFDFIIRACYALRSQVNFEETVAQFKADVLTAKLLDGTRVYYNRSIMNKFFVAKEKASDEHKVKLSLAKQGRKRKPFTDETKTKMSIARKIIIVCPHCNKEGSSSLKRWHFDNCKYKPDINNLT